MEQQSLIGNIVNELSSDQRVMAAWLAGSLGRGAGDEFSDVDVWLIVGDEDRDAFVEEWPKLAERISVTVLRQRVEAGLTVVFNHITADWSRFDVSIGAPADVQSRSASTLALLFDKVGLQQSLRPSGEPLAPSPRRVAAMTTEFLRVLGLLPVVLGREEYVVAASGASLLRTLVIQLMVEDVAVEDRGGALHLAGLLPPQRLAALAALPAIEATRESAVATHLACAHLFLPLARDLCARVGVEWPTDLELAARSHLSRALHLEVAV